jgi:hypothetical protein
MRDAGDAIALPFTLESEEIYKICLRERSGVNEAGINNPTYCWDNGLYGYRLDGADIQLEGDESSVSEADGAVYWGTAFSEGIQLAAGPHTLEVIQQAGSWCYVDWLALTPSIVGMWQMDEGGGDVAHDVSGYGNSGMIHGAIWAEGIRGSGLEFDGVDDYVEVADNPTLDLQQFTIAGWVRPDVVKSGDNGCGLIAKVNSYQVLYWWGEVQGAIRDTSGVWHWIGSDGGGNEVGRWYHVAMSYDGENLKMYIDGVLQDTASYQCEVGNSPSPFTLSPDWGGRFDGRMDEVRLYGRALSADEVASLSM